MADDDLIALDKSKSSNPKPIPKPGSLKPAGSSKKNSKDYKSLTGRQNTPDLYEIMQVLGKESIEKRINKIIEK